MKAFSTFTAAMAEADPARSDEARRRQLLDRAVWLEHLTIGWNVIEAVVAITAALAATSVALLGFGLDSVVESASAGVLLWRLRSERSGRSASHVQRTERRAQKLVGASLVLLAGFVSVQAVRGLLAGDRAGESLVGIVLTSLSLAVMWWLAREKHRVAEGLSSRAMAGDAFQTDACFWISLIVLVGIGLNAALGWWWADPVAALGLSGFVLREAFELFGGESAYEGLRG